VLAGAIGAALIFAASRYPAVALGVILAYTPFQLPLFAWALKEGAPAVLVRDAGYVKDAMVAGICIAAVRHLWRRDGTRLQLRLVDYAALAYLAIASADLLLPVAFPGSFGGQAWSIRLNAWRLDCLFVILFLFCRRAPFSRGAVRRLAVVVIIVGLAQFGSAVWEIVDQHSYSNFFVRTVELTNYEQSILHIRPGLAQFGYVIHNGVDSRSFIRAGGFFTDQIELGFSTVLPFAIGAQWLIGSKLRVHRLVPPVAAGATVLLALTRSAILACAVALALIVLMGFTRRAKSRLPALAMVLAGVFLIVPLAGHSTVVSRFASIFSSSSSDDNQEHIARTRAGFNTVIAHPVGSGLGANPGTGVRYHTTNVTIPESSYLQVGIELGLAGMVAFVLMFLGMLYEVWRRARDPGPDGELPAAVFAAGGGLLVGGLFLHIWTSFPVALAFWGMCGAVLAATDSARAAQPPDPREEPAFDDDEVLSMRGYPRIEATLRGAHLR
jgi:hypothetical protein